MKLGQAIDHIVLDEGNIFERSSSGKRGAIFPKPKKTYPLPLKNARKTKPKLPEVSELDVIRHYTRLSHYNYGIDLGLYPLGSCTMKYNPRINEEIAALSGFRWIHPMQPAHQIQGALAVMWELEHALKEITGLPAVSLQPAAGAHGEYTGIQCIRAYHRSRGNSGKKKYILIPDSAHGTNPATAVMCGYDVIKIPGGPEGYVRAEDVKPFINESLAGIMMTVPNTLGLFETELPQIAELIHSVDGCVYMDGANMNALVGLVRPSDLGIDVMHLNLHKTFSTPHGGGGPGCGPIAVAKKLEPFLPIPRIEKNGQEYRLITDRPQSIGRVRAYFGNFGIMVRALTYIRALGRDYLPQVSRTAILNANYIRVKLQDVYHLPYPQGCMHEVVFNDKWQNPQEVKTMDIAKRLIDYGYHPPTVYFPLVVAGALMIEPTECESHHELDEFIAAMRSIALEAKTQPELLKKAPLRTRTKKVDEVKAAKAPQLTL